MIYVMAAKAGLEPQFESNPEAHANRLFLDALRNKGLPPQLTSEIFVEALEYPAHFPVAFLVIQSFGQSTQTTYTTEYNASYVPAADAPAVRQRYHDEVARPTTKRVEPQLHNRRSPRLQNVVSANVPDWAGTGQFVYAIISDQVAPRAKYRLDVQKPTDFGDLNLVVRYVSEHARQLIPLYIDRKNVDTAVAQIGNNHGVEFNIPAVYSLFGFLEKTLGPVTLGSVRSKLPKLIDPTVEPFQRAGATTITQQFERFFVQLNPRDADSLKAILALDDDADQDELDFAGRHFEILHMMLFSLLQDQQQGYHPVQKLKPNSQQITQITQGLREAVTQKPSKKRSDVVEAINPTLGNISIKDGVDDLIKESRAHGKAGFGAAHTILSRYSALRLANSPEADVLEKLMQHFNRLASDPTAINKLKLDELLSP